MVGWEYPTNPREASGPDPEAVHRSAYAENERLGFPASAGSATAEEVAEWIRERTLLVATVDGEPVGAVRLEESDPKRAKVSRFAVREDLKANGIGSALLDRAEVTAREWDCETVWLTTPPEHPYLPEFYRDRGYEVTGPYPLETRDYDEVVFEKPLA